jgi:molybdopterin-binding protein
MATPWLRGEIRSARTGRIEAGTLQRRASKETTMKISARNVLKGRIKKLTEGVVNSEIIVELAGGAEVVSIITKSSAESLDLKEGKEVYAVIKASDVMIAVE